MSRPYSETLWRILARAICMVAAVGIVSAQSSPAVASRDISIVHLGSAEELKTIPQVPRGYAVVIGISKYKNLTKEQNLAFAEKDAENVYSTLISKEGGNIEFQNVKRLIGPQATLENIRNALEVWLPAQAQESDRVVVYFVGHGVTGPDGLGYFAPYDIDPKNVQGTGYSMAQMGDVISKKVKAKWKVLLTDACHSGNISVSSTPDLVNKGLETLPRAFLTLTSSRASEPSFEDPGLAGGNGVFSYFLTQGWGGAADDNPKDGVVTADELILYVQREVRNHVAKLGRQQHPLDLGNFDNNLVLGFSPVQRARIAASLPELSNGSFVIEVNRDSVEVFIDDKSYGVVNPTKALTVPGLPSGAHKVRGVRAGYEPVSMDVSLAPGATKTVSLLLLRQRTVKPAAKVFFDQGDELWLKASTSPGNLAKASDLFTKALKEDPTYSQAALGLCHTQEAQDKVPDALKSCSRAIDLDPTFSEARTQLGVLYMANGDYAEAVRQLQRVSQDDPHNSFAQSSLAEALYLADRPTEAEEAAGRALALDAYSGQAYLLRGEARRSQMKFDDAISDYTRVLQVQEFGSGTLRVAAYWLIGTGMKKHRSGREFLYRSQKASAYYGLCAAEIGRENFLRAVRYCKNSLSAEGNDVETNLLLAQCYAQIYDENGQADDLKRARDHMQTALKINPDVDNAAALRQKLKEIDKVLASSR